MVYLLQELKKYIYIRGYCFIYWKIILQAKESILFLPQIAYLFIEFQYHNWNNSVFP